MSAKKTIVVVGATGNQGSSIVSTILSHPALSQKYLIRGVTRNPTSDKAQALSTKYPDLIFVQGDLNEPVTLRAAFKDAYAVFGVTNFWESFSREIETQQGKNIADAAFATPGLRHLIWSSLPNLSKMSSGKYIHAAHFDGKNDVQLYIDGVAERNSVSERPAVTHFQAGCYMSNKVFEPRDGIVAVPWDESTIIPLFDAAGDTGAFVAGILEKGPVEMDGKIIRGVSEWLSIKDAVACLREILGSEVQLACVPAEIWKSFLPEAIREELSDTMAVIREFSYYGVGAEKDQEESGAVVNSVNGLQRTSFKQFLKARQ